MTPTNGNYYGTVFLNKNANKYGILVPVDLSVIKNYDIIGKSMGVLGVNSYTISMFGVYENCVIAYTDTSLSSHLGALGSVNLEFTEKAN